MKIVATIEARMTSSRLPGKVVLPAAGRPMLEQLVRRLRRVPSLSAICLATTVNRQDDQLQELAEKLGIDCYRGSEADVMARVIGAAEKVGADVVVEITADCPMIDPEVIEQTIQLYLSSGCDYAHNLSTYPVGMDTQVYALSTLKKSFGMTNDPLDREHVTRHIRLHPELFSHRELFAPPELAFPELSLTLDEQSDYELLRRIFEHFGDRKPDFSCRDVVDLLRFEKPDWAGINEGVLRKGFS